MPASGGPAIAAHSRPAPYRVLAAFIVMRYQGVNANLMSLGGIAIAIGAMIDAAIVMIENAHKHLEAYDHRYPNTPITNAQRWELIAESAAEVGPALFFSLLIITLSFIPVFSLEGQEGKLGGRDGNRAASVDVDHSGSLAAAATQARYPYPKSTSTSCSTSWHVRAANFS
jgi:AcrB/AcrD/AcrF family